MAVFHGHLTLLLHHGDLPPATTAIIIILYNTMPDTSGYGDDIRDDDTLVGDDNSSVSSLGSASTLVSEGANPGPRRLPNIRPHIDHRVDVAIIGSGITAVGVALSILPLMASRGMAPDVFVFEEMGEGAAQHDALMSFLPCRVFRPDGGLLPEKVLDFQVKNAEAVKELESKYLDPDAREFEMEDLYYNDEDFEFGKRTQRRLDELYPQYGATILEGDEVPHVSYRYMPACLDCFEVLTYNSMDIYGRVVLEPTRQD